MSSNNYYIYADSIDVGGAYSTSTSYDLEDSSGEYLSNFTTSSSYIVRGGYQSMEAHSLSMTIDGSSVSLGQLDKTLVKTGGVTVGVSSDSAQGYVLQVSSVSGSSIRTVGDGSVTAGSEEFGIAVFGAAAAFGDDRALAANLILATGNSAVVNQQTTLTFKASISADSTEASYSQTIILNAMDNL